MAAVKTSPESPAAELLNLSALKVWARKNKAPWLSRLGLGKETFLRNCSAALDPDYSPWPATANRPTLSSVHSGSGGTSSFPPVEPGADSGPLLFPYRSSELEALAAPQRMAHYHAELRRLHAEYLNLVAMLPTDHRLSADTGRPNNRRGSR